MHTKKAINAPHEANNTIMANIQPLRSSNYARTQTTTIETAQALPQSNHVRAADMMLHQLWLCPISTGGAV